MNKATRNALLAIGLCLCGISCAGKGEAPSGTNARETAERADSSVVALTARPEAGELKSRVFKGTCEEGATCILTLFNQEHSGDGIFSFTVLGPGNRLNVYKGRVYTLRGTDDATLWQCVADDKAHTFYFPLDADGQHIYKEKNDADDTKTFVLSALSAQEP